MIRMTDQDAHSRLTSAAERLMVTCQSISESRPDDIDRGRRLRLYRQMMKAAVELDAIRFPEPTRRR